ncbi:MAG: PEP-CTERM sorting domain-containing protein, partial [Puniceicoccales bacterium]
ANVAYLANPEPSTLLIIGLFTAGVLYAARRKNQQRPAYVLNR